MVHQRFKLFVQAMLCTIAGLLLLSGLFSAVQTVGTALAAPLLQVNNPNPVPPVMNYHGILRDPEGKPMSGAFKMTFRIYNDVAAPVTSALWMETHEAVTVRDGNFNALLGNNVALSTALFNTADAFIGVQVDPYDEMVPRQRFAMTPYAAHADFAHRLLAPGGKGQDALSFDAGGQLIARQALTMTYSNQSLALRANGLDSNTPFAINSNSKQNVGVGTNNPQANLHVSGNKVRLQDNNAVLDLDANGGNVAVSGTNGNLFLNSKGHTVLSSGVFGGSGNVLLNPALSGRVGIGLNEPQTTLDVNGSTTVRGNLAVNGSVTVNQVAPIVIVRYRNMGNDADFPISLSAQEWNCTAAGWSAAWQQKTGPGVNMVWTYVKDGGWWARVSFHSTADDENPDVDILCFRAEISSFEGDPALNEPN
jgi:hypothetical protein